MGEILRKLSFAALCFTGCFGSFAAVAQDTVNSGSNGETIAAQDKAKTAVSDTRITADMSIEQIQMNNQATEAAKSGDYQKAEMLFMELLKEGEFNYLWYQFGRLYALQGKCCEAYVAFRRVEGAPIVNPSVVSAEVVEEMTKKAMLELYQECAVKTIFHKCDAN